MISEQATHYGRPALPAGLAHYWRGTAASFALQPPTGIKRKRTDAESSSLRAFIFLILLFGEPHTRLLSFGLGSARLGERRHTRISHRLSYVGKIQIGDHDRKRGRVLIDGMDESRDACASKGSSRA